MPRTLRRFGQAGHGRRQTRRGRLLQHEDLRAESPPAAGPCSLHSSLRGQSFGPRSWPHTCGGQVGADAPGEPPQLVLTQLCLLMIWLAPATGRTRCRPPQRAVHLAVARKTQQPGLPPRRPCAGFVRRPTAFACSRSGHFPAASGNLMEPYQRSMPRHRGNALAVIVAVLNGRISACWDAHGLLQTVVRFDTARVSDKIVAWRHAS